MVFLTLTPQNHRRLAHPSTVLHTLDSTLLGWSEDNPISRRAKHRDYLIKASPHGYLYKKRST